MQTQRRFWKGFQQYNVVSFVVSSCIVVALVLYFVDVTPKARVGEAYTVRVFPSKCANTASLNLLFARQSCIPISVPPGGSRKSIDSHRFSTGEVYTPGAARGTTGSAQGTTPTESDGNALGNTFQSGQNRDTTYKMSTVTQPIVVSAAPESGGLGQLAEPAVHFALQKWTLSFKPLLSAADSSLSIAPLSASMLQGSADNAFPYGQCTWWANQRYYELHGSYVPWRNNADAFQWVSRALDFGWHVSSNPIVGSIMVLQPGVDGAYAYGHVGVVEQVLTDGRVIASSLNWGDHPEMVTQATYDLGPGVSFISFQSPFQSPTGFGT